MTTKLKKSCAIIKASCHSVNLKFRSKKKLTSEVKALVEHIVNHN